MKSVLNTIGRFVLLLLLASVAICTAEAKDSHGKQYLWRQSRKQFDL